MASAAVARRIREERGRDEEEEGTAAGESPWEKGRGGRGTEICGAAWDHPSAALVPGSPQSRELSASI